MALEVFYPSDIKNALLAAQQATGSALRAGILDDPFAQGYREGYTAALTTVALAFGLFKEVEKWQKMFTNAKPGKIAR